MPKPTTNHVYKSLETARKLKKNTQVSKNVIFMICRIYPVDWRLSEIKRGKRESKWSDGEIITADVGKH